MIIVRSPFRLSLFGGGTDYNAWFEENEGLTISCAFSKYCYISVRKLPPFFEHKSRVVYSKVESVDHNSEIQHPAIHGCLKYMGLEDGLEVHYDGDLPARSGIGSSSSFTVGFLMALHAYKREMVGVEKLAREAIHIEQDVLGENVGIQDQIITAYGGIQAIKMGPGDHHSVSPVILPEEYLRGLEDHVLLGFTGLSRNSSDYAKDQIEQIKNGNSTAKLEEIHAIAREALHLLANQRDFQALGQLLDQSWKMKRRLTPNLAPEKVDDIYEKAMKRGAYGGKLMGAGGGGFMFFVAPPDAHEQIKSELQNDIKIWVPFSVSKVGAQIIFFNDQD